MTITSPSMEEDVYLVGSLFPSRNGQTEQGDGAYLLKILYFEIKVFVFDDSSIYNIFHYCLKSCNSLALLNTPPWNIMALFLAKAVAKQSRRQIQKANGRAGKCGTV